MTDKLNSEDLVKVYLKIRAKREELAEQDEALKSQMDLISAQILEICRDQDALTIRTNFGTISRRTKKNYWVTDLHEFRNFIQENKAFDLLQNRVHSSNMAEFLTNNPDTVVPGLNIDTQESVVITKPRG